jgi:hypothetical protein
MRARLEELERSGLDSGSSELLVVLCWLVRDHVAIDEAELNAARRRAMFVLAAIRTATSGSTRSRPSGSPTSSTRPSGGRNSRPRSTSCRRTICRP